MNQRGYTLYELLVVLFFGCGLLVIALFMLVVVKLLWVQLIS